MSSSPMRRSSNSKPARLSPFYRDLASPVSLHRAVGRYTIGYASSASAFWPETLSTSTSAAADLPPPPIFTLDDRADISSSAAPRELPPPPIFTLDDRADISLEAAPRELPPPPIFTLDNRADISPEAAPRELPPPPIFTLDDRADISPEAALRELQPPSPASPTSATNHTPLLQPDQGEPHSPSSSLLLSSNVVITRTEDYGSGVYSGLRRSPERSLWMTSPQVDSGGRDINRGSPVDGMVEPGALIALPSPSREVAKVQLRGQCEQNAGHDGDLWVTVFGFYPHDANLVLHEFEKCGTIVKHLPGPPGANWIHIQYANPYDAQKALRKNGIQLKNFLIVGVKPVDPIHRGPLTEAIKKFSIGSSIPLRPGALTSSVNLNQSIFLARSNHSNTSSTSTAGGGKQGTVSLATPSKSVVSKTMDLMFGKKTLTIVAGTTRKWKNGQSGT